MKIKSFLIFASTIMLLCLCDTTLLFCQVDEDAVVLAHSDKWAVKHHKGLFGLSKPAFGPYTTINMTKIDSPVIRNKTKDSSYAGAEISGSGTGMDIGKFVTIKKTKFYMLSLGTASSTVNAIFGIASVSHEKKQTFLGKMLSKDDEGKNAVLDYNRNVPGIIRSGNDSTTWTFFFENFTSGGRQSESNFSSVASISGGYMKNDIDSLYIQVYSSFTADIVLINQKGEHLAALAFKQKHPDIWIRNDIGQSYQQPIAALFAVFLSIKDF